MLTVVVLVSGAAFNSAWAQDRHAPAAVDDPRFEFLQQLEGTWVAEEASEEMSHGSFEFRVTAGGTAIEVREMVGTPMEMLTVYHMQGADLVGTHYCMLGNQPRVTAAKKMDGQSLRFSCDGKPGNTKSHNDHHVHGWTMRLDDEGRLHDSAEMMKDGEVTEAPTFVLTRQETTASR